MKTDSALEKKHKWAERPLPPGEAVAELFMASVAHLVVLLLRCRIELARTQRKPHRKPHPRLVFLVGLPVTAKQHMSVAVLYNFAAGWGPSANPK